MPPSNSPADTPIQRNLLPPLVYYHASVLDDTEDAGSSSQQSTPRPQPSTSSVAFPQNSEASQQIAPLLPLPTLNVAIYSHLPSPYGEDSDNRLRVTGPRRIMLRDRDPRLSNRDQAYGPRIPSVSPGQRQSLYDWAPAPTGPVYFGASMEESNTTHQESDELTRTIFGRSPPPLPSVRSRPRDSRHHDHLAPTVAAQDNSSNRPFPSLRRYIRSQPQRSRNIWAGYAAEAERDRERLRQRDRDRGQRIDPTDTSPDSLWPHLRRSYLARRNHRDSISYASCKELEETLKYLAKLRGCCTVGESLRLAITYGFTRDAAWLSYDGCDCSYDDFLLDTRMLKVPRTSWLDIGATFWGSQTTLSASNPIETFSPNRWTVKVNISGVDYENLRLNGTMEAYADWAKHTEQVSNSSTSSAASTSPSSPTTHHYEYKNSTDSASSAAAKDSMTPIVTYLEGEIIDFRTHTLQTTSYPSTITDDALYWRKLEPFSFYEPDALVHSLTSKSFMKRLLEDYVLMRWKEKCFIKGEKLSASEGGTEGIAGGTIGGGGLLTIGGFYFVSMKRSDGNIRGFYYDPKSTPYQELLLKPKKRVFPTYELR